MCVEQVIIGMDPHKRSATIEIIDDRENMLAAGRFGTDRDGYKAMRASLLVQAPVRVDDLPPAPQGPDVSTSSSWRCC
jgi:hypothetical protein